MVPFVCGDLRQDTYITTRQVYNYLTNVSIIVNLFVRPGIQSSKFSMTSFICSCVRKRIDNFSLPWSLVSKLSPASFWTRKICRVYGRQGNYLTSVYKIYFYGFGKQKAALAWDKCLYRVYKKNWTDLKLLSVSQNSSWYQVFVIYIYIDSLSTLNVE